MFSINSENTNKPPFLATLIIILLGRFDNNYEMRGDLEEEYSERLLSDKKWRVNIWYWEQVLSAIPEYIINFIRIKFAILHNYLLTTYRNILKAKWYFVLNIGGLTIGLISAILILLWVENEMSYEKHIPNSENIYIVINQTTFNNGETLNEKISPAALAIELKSNFDDIINSARCKLFDPKVVTSKNRTQIEESVVFADESFFEIFNYEFINGNAKNVFDDLNSIVISQHIAEIYFPKENPIGQKLKIDNQKEFIVTGVIADVSFNSSFKYDIILPFETLSYFYSPSTKGWEEFVYPTFVQVKEETDLNELNKNIKNIIPNTYDFLSVQSYLLPIEDYHLKFQRSGAPGKILNVYLMSVVAILILVMANLNFINLAIAKSNNRIAEIGHRKVMGADRKTIMIQFYFEAALVVFTAFFFSLLIIFFFEPQFYFGSDIFFNACEHCYYPSVFDSNVLKIIFISIFITIIISGFYPALFLSRLEPARIFKGKNIYQKVTVKKGLIIVQMIISFILISATIVINDQTNFLRNTRLGFDRKNNLIYMPLNGDLKSKSEKVSDVMKKNPYVINTTTSSELPSNVGHYYNAVSKDSQYSKDVYSHFIVCNQNFLSTLNIKLLKGRFFNSSSKSENVKEIVINQSVAKKLKFSDPIGKMINDRRIIGMVEDFHTNSLHSKIQPLVLVPDGTKRYLIIKIKTGDSYKIFDALEESWNKVASDFPFEFHFLSGQINSIYNAELRFSELITVFSVISIFIACIGLIGLSSFIAEKRKKEISVRKVLGASNFGMVKLIISDFIKWTLLSCLVAAPLAYYFSHTWLNRFAYHVDFSPNFLTIPVSVLIIISIITVGIQAFISTNKNPVKNLNSDI